MKELLLLLLLSVTFFSSSSNKPSFQTRRMLLLILNNIFSISWKNNVLSLGVITLGMMIYFKGKSRKTLQTFFSKTVLNHSRLIRTFLLQL